MRDKQITLRQFRTRCLEKLSGNQFHFTDYDDIVHLIHPDCRNTDSDKINRWSIAAFGVPMSQLPLSGPESFINHLEPWQVQPRCLRSITGFSTNPRRRAETAGGGRNRGKAPSFSREFNFQKDPKPKTRQPDSQLSHSVEMVSEKQRY